MESNSSQEEKSTGYAFYAFVGLLAAMLIGGFIYAFFFIK